MTIDQLNFLGIFITMLVTVVGWIYTASVQKRILKETLKAQTLDREINMFRERLETIRKINSALLDQSGCYTELTAMIQSDQFNFEKGGWLIEKMNNSGPELHKVLFDPSFRSILVMLPENIAESLKQQLTGTLNSVASYHASAIGLSPLEPKLNGKLQILATQAQTISEKLLNTASMFADAFAILDKSLANSNVLPRKKKFGLFEWLKNIRQKKGN